MKTSVAQQRAKLRARLVELDTERGHVLYALGVLDEIDDAGSAVKGTAQPPTADQEDEVQPSASRVGRLIPVPPVSEDEPDLAKAEERIRAYLRRGETSAYIIAAVFKRPEDSRMEQLVTAMRDIGWNSDAKNEAETVRAAITRMVSDGIAVRSGYGVYRPNMALAELVEQLLNEHPLPDGRAAMDDHGRFTAPVEF